MKWSLLFILGLFDSVTLCIRFWGPWQPNYATVNQACVELQQTTSGVGEWNDFACFIRQTWICEKKYCNGLLSSQSLPAWYHDGWWIGHHKRGKFSCHLKLLKLNEFEGLLRPGLTSCGVLADPVDSSQCMVSHLAFQSISTFPEQPLVIRSHFLALYANNHV